MGALEVSVNPASRFRPGNELARRADERASWTCAISIGDTGSGTGLLVNRDMVLTNYHVIAPLLAKPELYRVARCRFDFNEAPETGEVSEGTLVAFAQHWEGPWSRHSPQDEIGADSGFEPENLDYALIRLAEPIGEAPVTRGWYQRNTRGWLPLPSDPTLPRVGSGVSIWQHPVLPESMGTAKLMVMPMKWDQGVVLDVLGGGLRLRHNVKTLAGSSGAACFDANLDLVALHHSGDHRVDHNKLGKWNQAVPMTAIIAHLKREHADLIGVVPPAPVRVTQVALPVDRAALGQDMVEEKVRKATILMDRDNDEDSIAWARDRQNGAPGILHVLACRHIDSHRNFLKRLVKLSLGPPDLGSTQGRQQAFLVSKGVSAEYWQSGSMSWPSAKVTPEHALQVMRRDLEGFARAPRPTVVDITVDAAGANLSRDKKLIPAVAKFCTEIATADRLQVFIVYYDRQATPENDKTRERRKSLVRMWTPDKRPLGCGVCLHLADIDSIDLEGWCRTVEPLWQGEDGALIQEVERLFGARKLPMAEAESGIAPLLRRNLALRG